MTSRVYKPNGYFSGHVRTRCHGHTTTPPQIAIQHKSPQRRSKNDKIIRGRQYIISPHPKGEAAGALNQTHNQFHMSLYQKFRNLLNLNDPRTGTNRQEIKGQKSEQEVKNNRIRKNVEKKLNHLHLRATHTKLPLLRGIQQKQKH